MNSDFERGFFEDGTKITPEILPLLHTVLLYCTSTRFKNAQVFSRKLACKLALETAWLSATFVFRSKYKIKYDILLHTAVALKLFLCRWPSPNNECL